MKRRITLIAFLMSFALAWAEEKQDGEKLEQLEQKVDVLTQEIERIRLGEVVEPTLESAYGLGPAASKVYHVKKGVSIAGYGEMVYKNFSSEREDGTDSGATDQIDLLRAVLYTGYKFTDKILLNSEIEFEHAGEEVSVEFAYIDYNAWPELGFRAGMVLIPVGLINEQHEPIAFHGANRPNVERNIIPTTWRENGAGVYGEIGPFVYRTYVVAGLNAENFSAGSGLRSGRQNGSESSIEDAAWTARVDYVGLPGLLAGASTFIGNSGQDPDEDFDAKVTLWDLHAKYEWQALETRALYTQATITDVGEINAIPREDTDDDGELDTGLTGNKSVGEKLYGGYLETAYNVFSPLGFSQYLAPFFRWERYNTQENVPGGFTENPANNRTEFTYGLTYKPIDNLALKFDYQDMNNKADAGVNQVNLGIGYVF
ncbi:MAG: hypothetical protein HY538_08635 [Deltaproteobacteria bacterium]|nr:hypothetical protein [Deltaproteobacteria bacterium]